MRVFVKLFILAMLIPPLLSVTAGCASRDSIRKPVYKRGSPAARTDSRGRRYHVVRKGETLFGIARKYGVPVAALKAHNRISDERNIKVGTKLFIPGAAQSVTKRKRTAPTRTPRSAVRFIWPLKKVSISSRFGIRSNRKHDGIDLRAPKGTSIMAAARGKVIFSGKGPSGYGNMIIVKHDRRTISIYAHNDRNLVRKNQYVNRGQSIATIGRTGRATGYHVHFEIRINRKPVDPERFLPRRR